MGRCATLLPGLLRVAAWPAPRGRGRAALRQMKGQKPLSFLCPVTGAAPIAGVMCASTMRGRLVVLARCVLYPRTTFSRAIVVGPGAVAARRIVTFRAEDGCPPWVLVSPGLWVAPQAAALWRRLLTSACCPAACFAAPASVR